MMIVVFSRKTTQLGGDLNEGHLIFTSKPDFFTSQIDFLKTLNAKWLCSTWVMTFKWHFFGAMGEIHTSACISYSQIIPQTINRKRKKQKETKKPSYWDLQGPPLRLHLVFSSAKWRVQNPSSHRHSRCPIQRVHQNLCWCPVWSEGWCVRLGNWGEKLTPGVNLESS